MKNKEKPKLVWPPPIHQAEISPMYNPAVGTCNKKIFELCNATHSEYWAYKYMNICEDEQCIKTTQDILLQAALGFD